MLLLIACSVVAIFTTVGIVLSLIFREHSLLHDDPDP
jgi:hypothetical protein